MTGSGLSKVLVRVSLGAVVSVGAVVCSAQDPAPGTENSKSANSSLYLKVQLSHPVKLSKLKPGEVVDGRLALNVYAADRELFSAGSHVRLTVDHLEKAHRIADDHWPWVVKVFTPRHENYPVFKSATVSGSTGESGLQVSLLSASRRREVYAQATKKKAEDTSSDGGTVEVGKSGGVYGHGKLAAPMLVLEAFGGENVQPPSIGPDASSPGADLTALATLPAGTACKILLLGDVSASKSKPGDVVKARLLEPVMFNSRVVLPAGSLIEGKVAKKTPPRWGSRAGSLSLVFTSVTLPGGNLLPLVASLTGAELDRRSHTKMDAEGELHGERPGKAWMAINIGVTAGLAKEVDDATQLIIEAIITRATDAPTAGTARIVSSCISGIYMVSRHGRDVVLPRFTEMNIALDRPLTVTRNVEAATASDVVVRGD